MTAPTINLLDSPGMPAYSARANGRLCTVDTGILQSAKAADQYDDIHDGGCVLVKTTPTLRWPAKSEATSPALLPPERKPVDGESFDSDPGQRNQDRRRRRTTLATRSLPARAGWPYWNAHRLRHVAMWCVHRAVRRSYGQILHGAGSAGGRPCRHDDRRFG